MPTCIDRRLSRQLLPLCVGLLWFPLALAVHAQASPGNTGDSSTPAPVPRHPQGSISAPATTQGDASEANQAGPIVPAGPPAVLPHRKYQAGTLLHYQMHATNRGWSYQVDGTSQVLTDAAGNFYESIHWSNFHSNLNQSLSQASLGFEQTLSLTDPQKYLAVPNLNTVQPMLIGPITDLLTLYSDLSLATQYNLTAAGEHAFFATKKANSWADGRTTLLGQDAIDFNITLTSVDPDAHTAIVEVRHVPPKQLQIKLPAAWMQEKPPDPIADVPNNWVQVQRAQDGPGYIAQAGQEEFDVTLTVDTQSGRLLAAHMHNPVTFISRTCKDEQLLACDAATPHTIVRDVDLKLVQ